MSSEDSAVRPGTEIVDVLRDQGKGGIWRNLVSNFRNREGCKGQMGCIGLSLPSSTPLKENDVSLADGRI